MKNTLLFAVLFLQAGLIFSVNIATDAEASVDYGDAEFYIYLINKTGRDLSFCRKEGNPEMVIKPGIRIKISEYDLEVSELGQKTTSMSWVQTSDDVRGKIYQLHGNFFARIDKLPSLPLELGHSYEVNFIESENQKMPGMLQFKEI